MHDLIGCKGEFIVMSVARSLLICSNVGITMHVMVLSILYVQGRSWPKMYCMHLWKHFWCSYANDLQIA